MVSPTMDDSGSAVSYWSWSALKDSRSYSKRESTPPPVQETSNHDPATIPSPTVLDPMEEGEMMKEPLDVPYP